MQFNKSWLAQTPVILIIVVAAILAFMHLGNAALWDDEAQVGIIAHNFLKTGTFTGWDGRNLYGYRDGALLDQHLNYINSPLDSVVAAAAFKMFGDSTWAARALFVAIGIVSLIVLLLILRLDFPNAGALHAFALAIFALSPVFLLNIRNCRYYAISLLASLCMYYAYRKMTTTLRQPASFAFAIATAVAFYASFLLSAAFLLALIVVHLLFHRKEVAPKDLVKSIPALIALCLMTLPYAVIHQIWVRHDTDAQEPWLPHRLTLIWWNLRDLNLMTAMPWMIGLALAMWLCYEMWVRPALAKNPAKGRDKRQARRADVDAVLEASAAGRSKAETKQRYRELARKLHPDLAEEKVLGQDTPSHARALTTADTGIQWIVLSVAYVVFLSLMSIQPTQDAGGIADIRYLFPAVPFLAGLTGALLAAIFARIKIVALGLAALVICTNATSLLPASLNERFPQTSQFMQLLPAYVNEVTHPYPTANQMVADFLKQNAKPDATVFTDPDFESYPTMFYNGEQVRICAQLDDKSTLPFDVVHGLNPQIYQNDASPDWIIFYGEGQQAIIDNIAGFFSRPHMVNGQMMVRGYRLAAKLPVYAGQTQRPELPWHHFGPVTGFSPDAQAVVIVQGSDPQPAPAPPPAVQPGQPTAQPAATTAAGH